MGSFDTNFPADTLEFCPSRDTKDLFVCGTYKLEESPPEEPSEQELRLQGVQRPRPQKRVGECLVFNMDSDQSQGPRFTLRERISRSAITDIKWCARPVDSRPLLAMAQTDGIVVLMTWGEGDPKGLDSERSMNIYQELSVASNDVLCLALDWSNRRSLTNSLGDLVVSLSNGSLCLLRPTEDGKLSVSNTWHAHDFEPWAAAWNYWDTNVIYSGGDDLKLKCWDIRAGFDQPSFTNKRFDAGVTSIQSHPYIEHLIAVGSYDDTVRLFDVRNLYRPISTVDVGGGAWRVKWHPSPSRADSLLVACMHAGARVVRFDGLSTAAGADSVIDSVETVKTFEAHKSMTYGADWSWSPPVTGSRDWLIATCSFYDHVIHTWTG